MKKTIFKLLALTLALLMLLPLTMACKKDEEKPNGGESNSVSTEGSAHPVPPQDLGGKEFEFATALWASYTPLTVIDVMTEEFNGEFVNDGAHNRNLYMQETFNCTVKQVDFKETEVTTKLQQNAMAGDDAFDFVIFRGREYIAAMNGGYLAEAQNFNLNFENPWWDKNAIDAMTINNKCFGIVGDVTTNHLNAVFMTAFNKTLVENNKLDNPYELVNRGDWTFEKMIMMSKAVAALDSDPSKTKDSYLGITYTSETVVGVLAGCGVKVIDKNAGTGELSLIYSDYQSNIQDIFRALYDESHAANTFRAAFYSENNDVEIFNRNKVLFALTATHVAGFLRSSDVEYGILPYPKFTDTADYCSSTAGNYSAILGIPLSNTNVDVCSVFLEAYAEQGQQRVRPQFYENMLLRKVGRDVDSFEMLQYIYENLSYDVGVVFGIATKETMATGKSLDTDVASFMSTNRPTWRKNLNDIVKAHEDKAPIEN